MALSGRERSPASYTLVALNPSLRKEVSILSGIFSSNRKVHGRSITLLLPHYHIFQRIGITIDISNMFLAQLLDRHHLVRVSSYSWQISTIDMPCSRCPMIRSS